MSSLKGKITKVYWIFILGAVLLIAVRIYGVIDSRSLKINPINDGIQFSDDVKLSDGYTR